MVGSGLGSRYRSALRPPRSPVEAARSMTPLESARLGKSMSLPSSCSVGQSERREIAEDAPHQRGKNGLESAPRIGLGCGLDVGLGPSLPHHFGAGRLPSDQSIVGRRRSDDGTEKEGDHRHHKEGEDGRVEEGGHETSELSGPVLESAQRTDVG